MNCINNLLYIYEYTVLFLILKYWDFIMKVDNLFMDEIILCQQIDWFIGNELAFCGASPGSNLACK